MRMVLTAAAIAFASPAMAIAQEMTIEAMPYAAMCGQVLDERDVQEAAFAVYETQNPDNLTDEEMSAVLKSYSDPADFSEILEDEAAKSWLQSICDGMREAFLPA